VCVCPLNAILPRRPCCRPQVELQESYGMSSLHAQQTYSSLLRVRCSMCLPPRSTATPAYTSPVAAGGGEVGGGDEVHEQLEMAVQPWLQQCVGVNAAAASEYATLLSVTSWLLGQDRCCCPTSVLSMPSVLVWEWGGDVVPLKHSTSMFGCVCVTTGAVSYMPVCVCVHWPSSCLMRSG
jgi:hypothetical protein